ncbi:Mak10 subunit, NatC N-terminal acetyltransferase-domain-containing protein [Xylaria sp. FL1042]|nr:Mak10 subunit, NatC N-terminal acetyltransferase-domain-containing protein [Xylaria sp. FL1042]
MQPLEPPMPPPPNISHPGIMTIDITAKFTSAIKTLSPGEVIKDENFTLFESVSALEIMDRKMDSGVLNEGESLDEEYDVARNVLPEEILGIIDELLCLEMAWHLGYPLSQTILTSVYVDALMNGYPRTINEVHFTGVDSHPTQDPSLLFVLRAYCAGLLRACLCVYDCMKEELYYEEEDFVTNTYERSLLGQIPILAIKELLQNTITELRTRGDDFPPEICAALESRLELRISFLEAVDLSAIRNDTSELPKLPWTRMRRLIEAIENQHAQGKPLPEAFSTKLQRRLASTMPPRPMVTLGFDECMNHFKRFFEDGNEVIDVLQYTDPQSLLNFILMFQAKKPQPLAFIRSMLQNLLFKDMVVLGHFSVRQLLDHDLCVSVLPCGPHFDRSFDDVEVTSDPRHKVASAMEVFRHRVADPYFDLLRLLNQNRCRVRRTLCHHIQIWEPLETDIADIEDHMQSPIREVTRGTYPEEEPSFFPLSTWAYLFKLRQMEWIVQLGFELRIYQPDELASMYYYLKRLTSRRGKKIDEVKKVTAIREERAHQYLKIPKKDPLPPAVAEEFERSKQYQHTALLDAACTWELSAGLHLLYLALLRLGLVKPPPRPYGTDALRYELRMRPFADIEDPPLPSYEEFKEQVELSDTSTTDVLRLAGTSIGAARKGFEACVRLDEKAAFAINANAYTRWVGNAKNCLRATIAAGVAVSMLSRAYEKMLREEDGRREGTTDVGIEIDIGKREKSEIAKLLGLKVTIPEAGDGYHDWWIVPKLARV